MTPLAFETKVSIAQNLNLMIQNKATDSVFALISSVFALDDTDIFKYILEYCSISYLISAYNIFK